MATLRVNPTRMELTRLKRRLNTAARGHKLLKDKRDEMMRQFIALARRNHDLRLEVEKALSAALAQFALARATIPREALEGALLYPARQVDIAVETGNVMSVRVPKISITDEGQARQSYGTAQTTGELDRAIAQLAEVLPQLVELASMEKTCNLLADEIERTRRRVNALEYKTIPELGETIHSISMKLDENERGNLTRLMKTKELLQKRDS
nr:V-type ATP synthase subunit D [bacterium]